MRNISFREAKLLREAMLVNGMLANSESWKTYKTKNIEQLDQPDTILMFQVVKYFTVKYMIKVFI